MREIALVLEEGNRPNRGPFAEVAPQAALPAEAPAQAGRALQPDRWGGTRIQGPRGPMGREGLAQGEEPREERSAKQVGGWPGCKSPPQFA